MVIGIFNFKGGVGKTFLASHILMCLAEMEKKVLGIDLDPQGDLMKWVTGWIWNREKTFSTRGVDLIWGAHPDHEEKGFDIPSGYEYIILDGRPTLDTLSWLLDIIDCVIVPVKGRLSFDASIELGQAIAGVKPNTRIYVIRNEILPQRVIAHREEIEFLKNLGIGMFQFGILRSVRVRQAEAEGKAIWEMPYCKDGAITGAIKSICHHIIEGHLTK